MFTQINNFITWFDGVVWGLPLIILILVTGIFLTVRLGLLQVRYLGKALKFMVKNEEDGHGEVTSFGALCTALSATIGTGNIVGVASALVAGGPGAIFWMWVIAFFGMATIYAEATLAIETRQKDPDGSYRGGPVYYITTAFKGGFGKFLAGFFAVAIILALGFMGCMVQSNSIGDAFHNAFGLNRLAVGVVVAAIAAFIFLGGVQRIAAVTEKSCRSWRHFTFWAASSFWSSTPRRCPARWRRCLCWRLSRRPWRAALQA